MGTRIAFPKYAFYFVFIWVHGTRPQSIISKNRSYLARSLHVPNSDLVIGITSEQSLTISRPSHGQTLWGSSAGRISGHFRFELLNLVLAFQIPNHDGRSGSGAQPVAVGGEAKSVNCVGVIQSVQMFAVIEVPEHGLGVLAAGGAEGAVGRHGDGVQVAGVADVVGLEPAVGQVPHLF